MSLSGRPKGSCRRAQHDGTPASLRPALCRRLRLLVMAGLCLLGAVGAAAQSPLTLEAALRQAAAPGGALAPRDALVLGERWPSPTFGPWPWSTLPSGAATALHVKARFFDVVLADLQTGALNEQIAMAFVRFERAGAAGKAGSIETLQIEVRYRDLVAQRDASRAAQRAARSLLAVAMHKPGALQSETDEPEVTLPPASAAATGPPALGGTDMAAAERLQAWHELDGRSTAARSELAAARKRLQLAEARQDELRADTASPPATGALRLGDAMAAVAQALFEQRRAAYRLALFHEMSLALSRPRP